MQTICALPTQVRLGPFDKAVAAAATAATRLLPAQLWPLY